MWISSEDARSDFILAAAAIFLGLQVASLVARLPLYPQAGWGFLTLSLVWLVLLSCGAPWWLARHRRDIPGAFGLAPDDRGGVVPGLVLASPLLVGYVLATVFTGDVGRVLLSLLGRFTILAPTVAAFQFSYETVVIIASVLVLAVGSALTGTFLGVRARDAFRSPDTDLTELLRTFGMGGVGASTLLGLLVALRGDISYANALTLGVALLVIVLLADQYVPPRVTTPRAAVIGPAIAVLVLWVIAFGGPFRGDLLGGLHSGVSAGVVTLVAAAMLQVRHGMAAVVLLAASAVYPVGGQLLQPVPLPLLVP